MKNFALGEVDWLTFIGTSQATRHLVRDTSCCESSCLRISAAISCMGLIPSGTVSLVVVPLIEALALTDPANENIDSEIPDVSFP